MAGKCPKYRTVFEMQCAIGKYFTSCEGEMLTDENGEAVLNKSGQPIIIGKAAPTLTGLALALGFSSRKALLSYSANKKCSPVIIRAISMIEEYLEGCLLDKDTINGAKFILFNCFGGWRDKPMADGGEGEQKLDEVLSMLGGAMDEP